MDFKPFEFINNLYYLGIGMLFIFVSVGIIMLITIIMNILFKKSN